MAKKKKVFAEELEIRLAAALFCERVMEEKSDSTVSAIRIIDQITAIVPPDFDPEKPVPVPATGLIIFRSNGAAGEQPLRLVLRPPNEKRTVILEETMKFNAGSCGGVNMRVAINLKVKSEGIYWVDVIAGKKRFTSMPLHILIRRTQSEVQSNVSD